MNGLLIVGAGGHGKVVADAALACGWNSLGFVDDRRDELGSPLGLPIVGALAELGSLRNSYSAAVVAVGEARRRLELLERCRQAGFEIVSIVHPTACVSKFAAVAPGCVIFAQAAVNAAAALGAGCIINTGATVDHDCVLGAGVHVSPGAHLAGGVRVGDRAWIGIGAAVRQGVSIGRDSTIGVGAAVVTDVSEGMTVIGVPAKPR